MLQRVRELTAQAANDTNVDASREQITLEINQLLSEIDEMAGQVEFNTSQLIEGGHSDAINLRTAGCRYNENPRRFFSGGLFE